MKGPRFYNATDTIKNATEELKSLHKMASRNVSNTYTVRQKSIVALGDNFEENVA